MNDDGHRDTHAPPKSGWPTFGPDGNIIKDKTPRKPASK